MVLNVCYSMEKTLRLKTKKKKKRKKKQRLVGMIIYDSVCMGHNSDGAESGEGDFTPLVAQVPFRR